MNHEQYLRQISMNPNFAKENVLEITLSRIDMQQKYNNVRQAGLDSEHVSSLEANIFDHGQKTPITVVMTTQDPEESRFKVIDGHHRVRTFQRLWKKAKKNRPDQAAEYSRIKAFVKNSFPTECAEVAYQIAHNDVTPSKPNTPADAISVIQNVINGVYMFTNKPEDNLFKIMKDLTRIQI